jgi:aminopeptidase N
MDRIYLKDYQAPAFKVHQVSLRFELDLTQTLVHSSIQFERLDPKVNDLFLHGEDLILHSIQLDGVKLNTEQFQMDQHGLTLFNVPQQFHLNIVTQINPTENTALLGLFHSRGHLLTQCEAEGFRRMTYYLDRPDVLSIFTTTLIADRDLFPVLLANGNLVSEELLADNRHQCVWHDPIPKPCYLFATVAGNFVALNDEFITMTGKKIALSIYVEAQELEQCHHAMRALKKSMRWDEERYGREYDLERFMIVAVSDFNFGGMENKGLNIFNARYILADAETATDRDYHNVERVVAHEYFHNWTGDRITCRDWFQLSLKEGLTVFREQQFMEDVAGSASVNRIDDVAKLRMMQFAEDAGAMAHPVQPQSYMTIDNFYTATIYEKGAEVIRMMYHILGAKDFRRAMDLYFERHDGQAVTIEEFVRAMEDASKHDLQQFRLWYRHVGTPTVQVSAQYQHDRQCWVLQFQQSEIDHPENATPLHIPIRIHWIDSQGHTLVQSSNDSDMVFHLREKNQTLELSDIPADAVPSFLGHFSAPIYLEYAYTAEELLHLAQYDSDGFNRYEAGQRLMRQEFWQIYNNQQEGVSAAVIRYLQSIVNDKHSDLSLLAYALKLPETYELIDQENNIDPKRLSLARDLFHQSAAGAIQTDLSARIQDLMNQRLAYQFTSTEVGRRALLGACLHWLRWADPVGVAQYAQSAYKQADNMTDQIQALSVINHLDLPIRVQLMEEFYQKWRHNPLVLDKWFSLEASSSLKGCFTRVKALLNYPEFDWKNPNRVRALLLNFAAFNFAAFHREGAESYHWYTEHLLHVDGLNPNLSARLFVPYLRWKRFDPARQALFAAELQFLAKAKLSKNLRELVDQSLS